jgi:hypothetical protein
MIEIEAAVRFFRAAAFFCTLLGFLARPGVGLGSAAQGLLLS